MNKFNIFPYSKILDVEMDAMTASKTNGNTSKHIESINNRFTAAVNVIRGLPKNGEIDIAHIVIGNL